MKTSYANGGKTGDGHHHQKIFYLIMDWAVLSVYDDGVPVCAGFMYRTNSKAVWCDWIISNINYKNREGRKIALQLLIQTVERLAKDLGYKFIYALIKNKPLINTYVKMGFTEASSYSTEMIKHI